MSFESQLSEVFDIDVWNLKPQYNKSIEPKQAGDMAQEIIKLKNEPTIKQPKLLYTNNLDSSKIIKIFLKNHLNLIFLENIAKSLFFKSNVSIFQCYEKTPAEEQTSTINIFEEEFILDKDNLLSIQSKKHILEKLYKYADFNS